MKLRQRNALRKRSARHALLKYCVICGDAHAFLYFMMLRQKRGKILKKDNLTLYYFQSILSYAKQRNK